MDNLKMICINAVILMNFFSEQRDRITNEQVSNVQRQRMIDAYKSLKETWVKRNELNWKIFDPNPTSNPKNWQLKSNNKFSFS